MDFAWLSRWQPQLLAVLRIVTALLFLAHGTSKLLNWPVAFPMPEMPPLIMVAGILELVTGALMALGLFTRPAAFIASGEMAVAYFMGHAFKGFWPMANGGEGAILFCFIFLYIAAAGPGAWSIDGTRRGAGRSRR
jgi:putative oxidoreductase